MWQQPHPREGLMFRRQRVSMAARSIGSVIELGHCPQQRSSIDLLRACYVEAKEGLGHRIVTLSDAMYILTHMSVYDI
jgi:hypothetical protein